MQFLAASSGATFSIQIGASGSDNTYTARLDGAAAEGGYSMASLISDLNAVDKSSFAEANKVSFEAGDDGTSFWLNSTIRVLTLLPLPMYHTIQTEHQPPRLLVK